MKMVRKSMSTNEMHLIEISRDDLWRISNTITAALQQYHDLDEVILEMGEEEMSDFSKRFSDMILTPPYKIEGNKGK